MVRGITVSAVRQHELTPRLGGGQAHVVAHHRSWLFAVGESRSNRLVFPSLAVFHQSATVQHSVDRADRRSVHIGVSSGQKLHDLRRSPGQLLVLQAHNQRFDLERQLIGMAIGLEG
jgi:hypothetical protein